LLYNGLLFDGCYVFAKVLTIYNTR